MFVDIVFSEFLFNLLSGNHFFSLDDINIYAYRDLIFKKSVINIKKIHNFGNLTVPIRLLYYKLTKTHKTVENVITLPIF